MSFLYQDLMLDMSSLYFDGKHKNNTFELVSVTRFFYVYQDHKTQEWFWHKTYKFDNILNIEQKNILIDHQVGQKGFSTWQKARDEALNIAKKLTGKEINSKMNFSNPKYYPLKSYKFNHITTSISTYRDSKYKKWEIEYFEPDTQQLFFKTEFSHYFQTKQECLEFLYEYVAQNLDNLYFKYKTEFISQDALKIQNNTLEQIACWWMLFIKPEVNLTTIFV